VKRNVASQSPTKSTLDEQLQARARDLLDPWVAKIDDPRLVGRLRYGYRFEGPAVAFFESSPGLDDRSKWIDIEIAKFRFTKRTGVWSLYCMFRDLKWRAYEPLPTSADLGELVEEMDRDPTGIFFG
jgi:hypothetical protein